MVLADLFVSWFKIGMFAFGGGPAMIPLMKAECVDGHAWMTDVEYLDALALGYSLPGPIATKMSLFVGWQVAGAAGAAVSMIAVVVPSAVLMMSLGTLYLRYRAHPAVAGAMMAVKPVVIGLLAWIIVDLVPDGVRSWSAGLLAAGAFIALALKVHPAVVVVAAMGVGAAFLR